MAPPRSVQFSTKNSTQTGLVAGGTFIGEWEAPFYHSILVTIFCACGGTLILQSAVDQNFPEKGSIEYFRIEPGTPREILRFNGRRNVRVCYTNTNSTDCDVMELQTNYGDFDPAFLDESKPDVVETPGYEGKALKVTSIDATRAADTLCLLLDQQKLTNFHLAQITGSTNMTAEDLE